MEQSIEAYLNITSVHDSLLTGISIVGETSISITIHDSINNKKGQFVFLDVKSCRFDNFRQGNIILDISIHAGTDIGTSIDNELCYAFDIKKQELMSKYYNAVKNSIFLNELMLVNFAASYGAYGVIVCKSVVFEWLCE
jgi:hypothetical protein